MSGAYFIITGINCFIGGFYYGFFLKKGYYDLSTFANNIFFYFVLNIIFIVVGIIYQIYYKDIETNETNEIENAKKKINKNFSGSTFIVNPNKTNEYNVSLTTNKQINSVGNDNLNENSGNDEEEKDIEDNENDDKLLNESYH
jgi:amino acid permease